MRCSSCASELQAGSRFCPSCGQPTGSPDTGSPDELTTRASSVRVIATRASGFSGRATSPGVLAHGVNRFSSESIPVGGLTPGSVLAGRFRIVGLLGRGGMGEVYRADDMKLGQTVALKFLPREMSADPVWRERFFAEVRITRQLSHPNICRVYDVGDIDGRHFLSMEYIDGEDRPESHGCLAGRESECPTVAGLVHVQRDGSVYRCGVGSIGHRTLRQPARALRLLFVPCRRPL